MRIRAVVPARDASDWIHLCIQALFDAGFSNNDIIVVDDGSQDKTAELARDTGVHLIEGRTSVGAGLARNEGAAATCPVDILFFVDADVAVHKDTKARLRSFFDGHPEHVGLFGAYDDDPAAPQAVSRARNLLHRFVHLENAGDVASFWTGCGAVRAEAFKALEGFDPQHPMMEDIEFGIRLATKGLIRLDPALQGCHHKRWTLSSIAKTDLLHRAVPWARLQGRSNSNPQGNFGISARARLSVIAVGIATTGAVLIPLVPMTGASVLGFGVCAVCAFNARVLSFMYRIDGARILIPALAVLFVHYFCGGLGFAWIFSGADKIFGRSA